MAQSRLASAGRTGRADATCIFAGSLNCKRQVQRHRPPAGCGSGKRVTVAVRQACPSQRQISFRRSFNFRLNSGDGQHRTQLTPMMAQYRRIKGELPKDALLLFRLGDFYEMFF